MSNESMRRDAWKIIRKTLKEAMPDQAVETVIGQCCAFLEMGNGNYLYSTFADRVMELNTLTEKEKSD